MTKLSDLINVNRSVEVSPGVHVIVRSLSLHDVAVLLMAFPAIKDAVNTENMAKTLLASLPEAACSIIQRGIVDDNDSTLYDIVNLPFGVQFSLLHAILHLTIPEGFGPFAEKLNEVIVAINQENVRQT